MNRTDVIDAPALAMYAGTSTIPNLATVQQVVPEIRGDADCRDRSLRDDGEAGGVQRDADQFLERIKF